MNIDVANSSRGRLNRYVEKIRKGQLGNLPFEVVGNEVLRLLFAYKRHEHGLHLRWNRGESNYLALITVQELRSVKKSDPVLNGIYDALMLHAGGNQDLVDKLLETAEKRIKDFQHHRQRKLVLRGL